MEKKGFGESDPRNQVRLICTWRRNRGTGIVEPPMRASRSSSVLKVFVIVFIFLMPTKSGCMKIKKVIYPYENTVLISF